MISIIVSIVLVLIIIFLIGYLLQLKNETSMMLMGMSLTVLIVIFTYTNLINTTNTGYHGRSTDKLMDLLEMLKGSPCIWNELHGIPC
jgi:hypothetical protein